MTPSVVHHISVIFKNFHPDKQLFQVAGARDLTTDPWITRPELYPYITGDSLSLFILILMTSFMDAPKTAKLMTPSAMHHISVIFKKKSKSC